MPDFCSENTENITDTNYTELYQTNTRKSCLPDGGNGFRVDDDDIIDRTLLGEHIDKLLKDADASPPDISKADTDMNPAENFAKNAALLRKNIMSEFCFYYKRYIYILHSILLEAATVTGVSNNREFGIKRRKTIKLNSILNQISQILHAIANSRINTLKGYYGEKSGVNILNEELNGTREKLLKHASLLKKASLEKDAKAAMVEYSIEKNSSSRNLLAIYGFMNIVAGGLIFYLYRSAKA